MYKNHMAIAPYLRRIHPKMVELNSVVARVCYDHPCSDSRGGGGQLQRKGERDTDRQTDRQTDKQRDRET